MVRETAVLFGKLFELFRKLFKSVFGKLFELFGKLFEPAAQGM